MIYWAWPTLKVCAKSILVELLLFRGGRVGVAPSLKKYFSTGDIKFVITNLDHLLGLAYL